MIHCQCVYNTPYVSTICVSPDYYILLCWLYTTTKVDILLPGRRTRNTHVYSGVFFFVNVVGYPVRYRKGTDRKFIYRSRT